MKLSSFKYTLLVKNHHGDRKIVRYDGLPKQVAGDAYHQYMCYQQDFRQYFEEHQSESLFYGPKYTDYIPFDFDGNVGAQNQVKRAVYEFVEGLYTKYDIPQHSIRIYYSGSKGFHVLIPSKLFRIFPRYSLERNLKILAEGLVEGFAAAKYLDSSIYNTNSLIRVTNSVNLKSNLYKIPIQLCELRDLHMSQIKKIAKSPRTDDWSVPLKELTSNKELIELWEDALCANTGLGDGEVKKRLKIGVPDGFRHSTALSLAYALAWRGHGEERMIEELRGWDGFNIPPLEDDSWLEIIVTSARSKVGSRAPINEFRLYCQLIRNSTFINSLPDSQFRVVSQVIASTNTRDHEHLGFTVSRASLVISYKTLGDRSNTTGDVARETVRKLIAEGCLTSEITPNRKALILTWRGKYRGLFL